MQFDKENAKQNYDPNQPPDRYRGLINLGQTCYMNSYIQCLFFTKLLKISILNCPIQSNDLINQQNLLMLYDLKQLFLSLESTAQHSIAPEQFRKNCPEPFRSSQTEQDTSEFGQFYLDSLERSLKQTQLSKLIQECFFGKFLSSLKCTKCKNSQTKEESFSDLTILFQKEAFNPQENKFNFQKMIYYSYQKEFLQDLFCQKCNSKQLFQKKTIISELPTYLIIVFNRFQFDNQTQQRQKIMEQVDIQQNFHIQSIFPEVTINLNNPEGTFYLYAVIVHIGDNIDYGHYLVIVRENPEQDWYTLDDTVIKNLQKNFDFNNLPRQMTPYMLFYANKTEKSIKLNFQSKYGLLGRTNQKGMQSQIITPNENTSFKMYHSQVASKK